MREIHEQSFRLTVRIGVALEIEGDAASICIVGLDDDSKLFLRTRPMSEITQGLDNMLAGRQLSHYAMVAESSAHTIGPSFYHVHTLDTISFLLEGLLMRVFRRVDFEVGPMQ